MFLSQLRILTCVALLFTAICASVYAQGNPLWLTTELKGEIIAADSSGYTAIDMKTSSGFILRKYDRGGAKQKDIAVTFVPPDTNLRDAFQARVVGNMLVALFQRADLNERPETARSIGVWMLDGAAVMIGSVPVSSSFASLEDMQLDGGHLYWRRLDAGATPQEQIDRITLSTKVYKTITQLPSASINMRVRGDVITVLRNEQNLDGTPAPYLRNFDPSGNQTGRAPAANFFGNALVFPVLPPYGGAALIDEDPLKPDELPVAVQWDFLSGIVIFDRTTLKRKRLIERTGSVAPKQASIALRGDKVSGFFLGNVAEVYTANDQTHYAGIGTSAAFDGNASVYIASERCARVDPIAGGCIGSEKGVLRFNVNNALAPAITIGTGKPVVLANALVKRRALVGGAELGATSAEPLLLPVRFEGLVEPVSLVFPEGSPWVFDQAEQRLRYTDALTLGDALSIDTGLSFEVTDAKGRWLLPIGRVRIFNKQFPNTRLVEFYNSTLDHYFLTLEGPEAKGIDLGAAGPGWRRTGYELLV